MKVLIAGANGYIGTRLLPVLLEKGYDVVCVVRDRLCFKENSAFSDKVKIITGDLLKESSIEAFPVDIDAAYYVVNNRLSDEDFLQLAALAAHNFVHALDKTNCKQVLFLSKSINYRKHVGHLQWSQYITNILGKAKAALVICPAIPGWYLMWPFYRFRFKEMINKIGA